jgi:sarcosine oxidase gamma subunit
MTEATTSSPAPAVPKKPKDAPLPQASSTISTSAAGSAQDFGGGRVVFEISGTNLVGVLNRAGAKLQRFG